MGYLWHSISVNACADVMLFQAFRALVLDETMSWNMPVLTEPEKIPPLELNRLFMRTVLCLLVIIFAILAYYYLTHDKKAILYLLCLSLIVFVLSGFAAGWKLFCAGMLVKNNEIIELSNKNAESICCKWASEYISIIDFASAFPCGVEIDKFSRGDECNVIGNKAIKFPDEMDYIAVFQELLSSLRYKLLAFSQAGKLEVSLCGPEVLSLSLWRSFSLAWKNLNLPDDTVATPVFLVNSFTVQIDEWLQHPGDKCRLVVVCNPLLSDDVRHLTSDGACAWLLAPADITEHLPQKGRLYRALDTDSAALDSDLSNFLKYQEGTMEIENLWFDNIDDKSIINKVIQKCNEKNPGSLSQYFTEFILGKQGDSGIWMTIALALLNGKSKNAVNLIVSQHKAQTLLVQIKSTFFQKETL